MAAVCNSLQTSSDHNLLNPDLRCTQSTESPSQLLHHAWRGRLCVGAEWREQARFLEMLQNVPSLHISLRTLRASPQVASAPLGHPGQSVSFSARVALFQDCSVSFDLFKSPPSCLRLLGCVTERA